MANAIHYDGPYYDVLCKSCDNGFFAVDTSPDKTDEEKLAGVHCCYCQSKDVVVQVMNDAYYAARPPVGEDDFTPVRGIVYLQGIQSR